MSRFRDPQDPDFHRLNSSIGFDRRLWPQDVAQSRAHARMLAARGIITSSDRDELLAGLEEEGCRARVVRVNTTIDLGMVGLTAARLAGSGIGIGLQGKGTALIHRRDLPPLANLELYSMAPVITPDLYRLLGANAGRVGASV